MYKRVVCIVFLPIFVASNHSNNINYQLYIYAKKLLCCIYICLYIHLVFLTRSCCTVYTYTCCLYTLLDNMGYCRSVYTFTYCIYAMINLVYFVILYI